jgi:hypothetical protein
MGISTFHPEEGFLSLGGFLVIRFDPRTGHMAVHGDMAYDEALFENAVADAQAAAEAGSDERLPFQYAVVRVKRAVAYRPV